jgi:acylphosphatase
MKTVRIRCLGRVQGVFFRKYTQDRANKLGLVGFVKNEPDGSVVIFAYGEQKKVNDFIEWCKEGSPEARVDNVIVEELPDTELKGFEVFEVRY